MYVEKNRKQKIKLDTNKITCISAANSPRVANSILNLSLGITLLPSGQIYELSNLYKINIDENIKKSTIKKSIKIDNSVPTK